MSFFSQQNSINYHTFKYPISINDFEVIQELGHGAFGYVFKSKYKYTGMIYAVKYINQSEFKKHGKELDFIREKAILYDLTKRDYPHTVKLYADFEDEKYRYLVMELLEGTYLHEIQGTFQNNGYLDQQLVINILTQLLEILKYLHDTCHIMHRDIKPDNIILEKNGNIKVFDFGISAYLENQDRQLVSNKSLKGFKKFIPNEIAFSAFPLNYDYKIDVFALGFTMFSIMNKSKDKDFILPLITEGKYGNMRRFKNDVINNFYEPWLFEYLSLLYETDKNKRPTAAVALGFLKGLLTNPNMTAIYNELRIKRNKEISSVNTFFRRESFTPQSNNNPLNNSNNTNLVTNAMQNNMIKSSPLSNNNMNNINNSNINNPNVNKFFNKMTSGISEVEEFLRPNMGKENRIKSSMKCLLYVLYKLDIMNFIRSQLNILFNNPQNNYSQLVLYSFNYMLNSLQQLENGQINIPYYDQLINNFITTIFNNNNCGVSGARPIILFYMMASIFRDEFQQHFYNSCQNNIFDNAIQNKFYVFNTILPMNSQGIYNSMSKKIFEFKNKYKGSFVDNFYFLLLNLSKCPQCGNLLGYHSPEIASFLQLNVPNQLNNIQELINDFFTPKSATGNYDCKKCGCKGKKSSHNYCLNLPNYLFLELEDRNKIFFSEKIVVPLYNGQYYNYQFYACIFKRKINDIASFGAVLNVGNGYYLYSDDRVISYSSNITLDCPSLALYKRMAF